jgi:hypothetical protein
MEDGAGVGADFCAGGGVVVERLAGALVETHPHSARAPRRKTVIWDITQVTTTGRHGVFAIPDKIVDGLNDHETGPALVAAAIQESKQSPF